MTMEQKLLIAALLVSLVSVIHSVTDYKVCVNLNQEAISSESVPCSNSISNLNEIVQLQNLMSVANTVILASNFNSEQCNSV